jgi:hypothetical protein
LESKGTSQGKTISIGCGDYHDTTEVTPHKMVVLLGDASNDVKIGLPADIAFYMILHPNVQSKTTEALAIERLLCW